MDVPDKMVSVANDFAIEDAKPLPMSSYLNVDDSVNRSITNGKSLNQSELLISSSNNTLNQVTMKLRKSLGRSNYDADRPKSSVDQVESQRLLSKNSKLLLDQSSFRCDNSVQDAREFPA